MTLYAPWPMLRLVARRVAFSLAILMIASVALFVFVRVTTDPLTLVRGGGAATADEVPVADRRSLEAERHRLGLDRPLASQYFRWFSPFIRGDWGESAVSRRSVAEDARARLWTTTQLVIWAILLSLAAAVAVGVVSASRPRSTIDHALSGLAFLGLSMPALWFALLAIEWLVFQPRRLLGLDQPILFSVHSATAGIPLDYLRHLVLPVLTVSIPMAAAWSRYLRASMLDVLSAPYVRIARAKGISRRRLLVRHVLRNALIPFTTVSAVAMGTSSEASSWRDDLWLAGHGPVRLQRPARR